MAPPEIRSSECVPETPAPNPSRKRFHGSVTNLRSQKRRRMSLASPENFRRDFGAQSVAKSIKHGGNADRFVSNRPKTFIPLNITPRTRRISQQFGLVDETVLNFRDDTRIHVSTSYRDENTLSMIRKSASCLFDLKQAKHPTSVTENLNKRKDCLMVLDSPGAPKDPDAYPISWSRNNLIAVICGIDIYFQSLDTRKVAHLCTSLFPGDLRVIDWGGEGTDNLLATGTTRGSIAIWDAASASPGGSRQRLRTFFRPSEEPVTSFSWNSNVLASGSDDGRLTLTDIRSPTEFSGIAKHRNALVSLKWSMDGMFLASGDRDGIVHIWDRRAGKLLLNEEDSTKKIHHKAKVRALAWCSWQPDLLATGTTAPEGKIRIWSTSLMPSNSPTPLQIIPLNTPVLSLHWSPHCKELLSTHGPSFMPSASSSNRLKYAKNPLTNSITVHQYPSCKRLMTLTAHTQPVTHSCLGPTGEDLFTVCPREETIKRWHVWSKRELPDKRESAFDRYTIR